MTTIDPTTRFTDLAERETRAHDAHVNTVARLKQVKTKRALSTAEETELQLSQNVLKELDKNPTRAHAPEVCDPLFVATRTLLNLHKLISPELRTHDDGVLVFDPHANVDEIRHAVAQAAGAPLAPDPPITLTALTLGLLIVDGAGAPPVKTVPQLGTSTGTENPVGAYNSKKTIYPVLEHPDGATFTREFFRALGEARSYGPLADKVLVLLAKEGDPDGPGGAKPTARCEEFARVMRKLAEARVDAKEPQLRRRVNEMLDSLQNVGSEDRIAERDIDLPDLDQIQDENIMEENVRVMGPMIISTMFEELKVFQVVDRIVEQFQHGVLPIGPGKAGQQLYRYWREAPNRMSEQERRNFTAITLGVPGGDPGGMVNRDFNDLWIRFVSSVSSFIRQNEVDSLLRSATPSPISHQQVRKAARDLASNLSLHGYGMAHYAAREVADQVTFIIKLLQDPEIRACYGAKDMWQVVDQVATYDLGGAKTSSRYRTLATCGAIITAWLANNVARINRSTGPLLDIDVVRNPPVASDHKATKNPNDYDLVNACELWLADTATPDSEVEKLSQQPRQTPTMTSKPIPIPAMAREMLDDLDLGVGLGHGYAPSRPGDLNGNGHSRAY
ncbi:hypothetical protein ASE38_17200 [Cellulomonas sp. Root930]|nr:hypothetical protein ASE38_17200 [Cellulomonas sp. Root930]